MFSLSHLDQQPSTTLMTPLPSDGPQPASGDNRATPVSCIAESSVGVSVLAPSSLSAPLSASRAVSTRPQSVRFSSALGSHRSTLRDPHDEANSNSDSDRSRSDGSARLAPFHPLPCPELSVVPDALPCAHDAFQMLSAHTQLSAEQIMNILRGQDSSAKAAMAAARVAPVQSSSDSISLLIS